ncbi:hypothetical protein PAXRUDRAFT_132209 [Paxillus rubicundulus Ve08.2h10]|uniref:Uncharacterized protein n=1 Tax=Paxillus rubicundulus Ve08.2h10 TaxID=930991 RepID=A0A0D0E9H4_9AGAM|nr:hypothetical protein PAXRUDRAFT_132209 [Paxillus rubicundulus Ve08.2h10]
MFSFLFSCCGFRQRRHETHAVPDERTRLIPDAQDTPTQPRVIDQQRLKDRLGTVIRSKEGKMVNVNAQFPFNLHNQELGEQSSSRSSRHVSGGTGASSRRASPSPHRSLYKSPSSTSIHRDVEELATCQHLAQNGNHPAPILNVRLVKPSVAARSRQSARGRPGRSAEQNGRALLRESESITGLDAENREFAGEHLDDEARTPRAHLPSGPEERSCTDVVPAELTADRDHSTRAPPYPEDFTIYDAGAVSRSWGD